MRRRKSRFLYHGLTLRRLLSVVREDELHTCYHHYTQLPREELMPDGISLTRSFAVARDFASEFRSRDRHKDQGAIIVFERDKIEQQIGLFPVRFRRYGIGGSEFEERTYGSIRPAFASAVAILVRACDLRRAPDPRDSCVVSEYKQGLEHEEAQRLIATGLLRELCKWVVPWEPSKP